MPRVYADHEPSAREISEFAAFLATHLKLASSG